MGSGIFVVVWPTTNYLSRQLFALLARRTAGLTHASSTQDQSPRSVSARACNMRAQNGRRRALDLRSSIAARHHVCSIFSLSCVSCACWCRTFSSVGRFTLPHVKTVNSLREFPVSPASVNPAKPAQTSHSKELIPLLQQHTLNMQGL